MKYNYISWFNLLVNITWSAIDYLTLRRLLAQQVESRKKEAFEKTLSLRATLGLKSGGNEQDKGGIKMSKTDMVSIQKNIWGKKLTQISNTKLAQLPVKFSLNIFTEFAEFSDKKIKN